jgi:arylsulfatase A-like enzyme
MEDLLALPEPYGWNTLIASLLWREAEGRRKMVRTRDWKYVHDPMGDMDELYDLDKDPWETHNAIADPSHGDVLASLRLKLADWSVATEGSRAVPMPEADFYDRDALRGWLRQGDKGIRSVLGRASLR